MFHVPAHKHVGANPPAQIIEPPVYVAQPTFVTRTEAGRPRGEVAYHPLSLAICGRRYDLAIHTVDSPTSPYAVSDLESGQVVMRIHGYPRGDLREHSAKQLRSWAMTIGEEEFHQRIENARRRTRVGAVA